MLLDNRPLAILLYRCANKARVARIVQEQLLLFKSFDDLGTPIKRRIGADLRDSGEGQVRDFRMLIWSCIS